MSRGPKGLGGKRVYSKPKGQGGQKVQVPKGPGSKGIQKGQGSKGDHGTPRLNVEGPVESGLLLHSILLKRKTDYISKILYELYGN